MLNNIDHASPNLTCYRWHNLTISHQEKRVVVQLDDTVSVLKAKGDLYYLMLDPSVYFGGGLQAKDDTALGEWAEVFL